MAEFNHGSHQESGQAINPETKPVFERAAYAPTPLNPYGLNRGGRLYFDEALEIVDRLLSDNPSKLTTPPPPHVQELMRASVTNSLVRRFNNNSNKQLGADASQRDLELFNRAQLGSATPFDLIELVANRPEDIEAVELAKLSHPYLWNDTQEMDLVVSDSLVEAGFRERGPNGQNIRYYFMNTDNPESPAAATILRKADIASASLDDHNFIAVQRDTFVVDLTHGDTEAAAQEIRRWLQRDDIKPRLGGRKLPFDRPSLGRYIEHQLDLAGRQPSVALYPGVRSYYVHTVRNQS